MSTNITQEDRLIERLYWLIRLRWIAVIGVILTVLFVSNLLGLLLPVTLLFIITFFLCAYNLAFFFYLSYIRRKRLTPLSIITNRIANTQISLDLLSLAGLLHFSGGIENPFIFYFIFHMIIASVLLSPRAAFFQATLAVFLFSFIVILEYLGILAHYALEGFIPATLHKNLIYIFGLSFVFISTLYIAVYMATSISKRLKESQDSLEKANLLLSEKDRIKSEYVLRVTHDIKEDLSAIQGCIEPVTEGITGPLNERQKDLLLRAKERSSKLLTFIRALLEITRIKLTRKLKLESFSFIDLVKGISEDIEQRAKARNINFKVNIATSIDTIKGIRVYIEEAILNLLANAVKYTLSGGEVSLRVEDKGSNLLIKIKDTGIGVPKGELPFIFDEFYRAKNARQLYKYGTGLGLSIAKEIIQLHRGKIWVESEEAKGTSFYIELSKNLESLE